MVPGVDCQTSPGIFNDSILRFSRKCLYRERQKGRYVADPFRINLYIGKQTQLLRDQETITFGTHAVAKNRYLPTGAIIADVWAHFCVVTNTQEISLRVSCHQAFFCRPYLTQDAGNLDPGNQRHSSTAVPLEAAFNSE